MPAGRPHLLLLRDRFSFHDVGFGWKTNFGLDCVAPVLRGE